MNMSVYAPTDHRDSLMSDLSATYAGVVAFIAVATEGSFARAADRLGIGRSAVSRSVQRLEAQLSTRLFLRTTRLTRLTREGELFFSNCRPGVDRIVQALDEMRDLREGPPRGQLRVSATHGFGRKVIAPLLTRFREHFPEVTVELQLDEKAPDFAADCVDVAFRDGSLNDSQVIAKKLIPMRLLVCASPGYAERHGLPQSIRDLSEHRCVSQRQGNGRLRAWSFKEEGKEITFPPRAELTFNDDELVLQAVLESQGLAQLPAYQACAALRSGELVTCMNEFAPDDRGHYLCYLSRRQLPKRVRAFIDFMAAEVRALDLDCVGDARPSWQGAEHAPLERAHAGLSA